ncbi:MAG: DUF1667 domain-containing protein [Clostridia bacterium]|nr:DUF1667 domain-containing protein [Clostridia bacterium]
MKRDLICIVCPRGCSLQAEINGDKVTVTGNACPKGEQYAIDECTNPTRMVTSIIRVENRKDMMVSVKTAHPIPKGRIFELMETVRTTVVDAPVHIGDILIKDICGTDIVATKEIL